MKRRNCLRGLVGLLAGLVLPTAAFAMQTLRNPPQYLSTDAARVHDTCPGHNILSRFTCSAKEPPGFACFDVYLVEGDPVADERYRLLDQTLDVKNVTAEPVCPFSNEMNCENFLYALNYNLSFTFYIDNFPSSAYPQCADTYTCTRISCLRALAPQANGSPQAQKLSCVFKKNQLYFLGAEVSCQK